MNKDQSSQTTSAKSNGDIKQLAKIFFFLQQQNDDDESERSLVITTFENSIL